MTYRLPDPCLVVLVGPSGSGKSTWAAKHFSSGQIVSSDDLRAVVGENRYDQAASADAFELLDQIVAKRLDRRLTTVVDTLGLNTEARAGYLAAAESRGLPAYVVAFDTPPKVCKERNRMRSRPVPGRVLDGQLKTWKTVAATLGGEGFAEVLDPGEGVVLVPANLAESPELVRRQYEDPLPLRFGLAVSHFTWAEADELGAGLARVATSAELTGMETLWVMDHFRQIPQLGPEWDPMPDSYTTLAYVAGVTTTLRLGVLVTGPMYRNPAHLAKIIATLDVLSGGRAVCGIGAGWHEAEHVAYGWDFPPTGDRFDRLEDTLAILRLMWGPGTPSFTGKTISVPEAMCYPRPLQESIPILIGGGGEKRTLRLVAEHGDMANLFGDPEKVAKKIAVLAGHCEDVGRDLSDIAVTTLMSCLVVDSHDETEMVLEATRPQNFSPSRWRSFVTVGTVDDHIGRLRRFAEVGVSGVMVAFPDLGTGPSLARWKGVIDAFRVS